MGKRVQEVEKFDPGYIQSERAAHPDLRANKPGRRPKGPVGEVDAAEVHQDVLKHFFPGFVQWLKEVRDPRKKGSSGKCVIDYSDFSIEVEGRSNIFSLK